MSQDWYQDVKDFHEKFELHCGDKPSVPNDGEKSFRIALIEEEIEETLDAIDNDNLEEIADGIADSIYVLLGCAISYGIDIRPIWEEVQKSNMSKEKGHKREDGKVIKTASFVAPDIKKEINRQLFPE